MMTSTLPAAEKWCNVAVSKQWSHELVQVLHVHNLMFVFVLANGHCRFFFPRFATAGWVTLAPCCRTAMSTASPTSWWSSSANLIRIVLAVGSMYMMIFLDLVWQTDMPARFCIMCNSTVCIPNFLFIGSFCVDWLWIQLIQLIDLLFWGGKWDHPKIPIWVDPPCSLAIGWNFIQRRGLGKREAKKIMPKISAAMEFTRFLFHLQCFMQKLVWDFYEVVKFLWSEKQLHFGKVDHLWSYFPKRDDGDIENSDLVEWILRPSTPLMLTDAGDLAFFDLKSALYPLFQVQRMGWHCSLICWDMLSWMPLVYYDI